ncbi:MAG: response regulator [Chloroflexi bacterium]|jgi:DNA-binding response OmpR family regulator|nr:response regulator [Chloroflexota bacterium]
MASAPKILVAEDAADLRDAIVLVLLEQGYRVQAARDGHEATLLFPEFNPDLVVLDMRMPKMNGPSACAVIRQTSQVPVIMFTSTNDATEVRDAIIKGASDFVLKSTGVTELTDRIAFHLNKPDDIQPEATPIKTKTVSASTTNRPATTTLIIDPDPEARAVIKAVLTRLNQSSEEAATAAEAIRLFKQIDPDIVISEWSLPDMDGFSMLTELKGTKKSKDLIRLMMSTRLSPEAQRKAHYLGIKNFLIKPLAPSKVEMAIADCVRAALRNKKKTNRKAA